MKQHRLVIDTNVLRADLKQQIVHSGLFQMTHIQNARGALKHDDMIDVLAMGVGHWAEYLNADAKKLENERKAKADAAWEAAHFGGAFGRTFKPAVKGFESRRGRGRPQKRLTLRR